MEVMSLHPNFQDFLEENNLTNFTHYGSDEEVQEPEGFEFIIEEEPILVERKGKPIDLILHQEESLLPLIEKLKEIFPEFLSDPENLGVIRSNYDLLTNLVLRVKYTRLMIWDKIYSFDENLANDKDTRLKFRDLILNKRGYFEHDSNYFELRKAKKPKGTSIQCIKNLRVTLFWSNIILDEIQIKRILTLGLAFLMEEISEAELIFHVNEIIKVRGKYDIFLNSKEKVFVRIGIRLPLFTF